MLPYATDRATGLLSMHGGGYGAALAGLLPAVPSHARRDYVVGVELSTDAAIVSRHIQQEALGVGGWVRDMCCHTRLIELLGCSAHAVVGVMRLPPACQQL